jgi:hypothetical protein
LGHTQKGRPEKIHSTAGAAALVPNAGGRHHLYQIKEKVAAAAGERHVPFLIRLYTNYPGQQHIPFPSPRQKVFLFFFSF